MAPVIARCTNRADGPIFATFRVIHRLADSESAGEEFRSQTRPVRPVRSSVADRAARWRHELATGAIPSRAALARREGLSRARITQILSSAPGPLTGGSAALTSPAH